ncbi:hypothetical protein G2W53_023953 [Senna tora]|uniref:Uncharacterized protein n=1 Tax=Senna tora TaxID=362788 RepID=A0A834TAB1_9FABA|nr:hypothetical protein G2W53_023953 [Senna tora]
MNSNNFRIDPNDRFLDRDYSRKRFRGAPRERLKGFGCQKRVKFTVKDVDSSKSSSLKASPIPLESKEVLTYANPPKTSEYAFFKKLKEDAGQRCHSNSTQKDAHLLKKPESNDRFRERANGVRVSSKCFNRSTLIESLPTVNSDSFLSPSDRALKKPDEYPVSSTSTQKHFQGYADTFQPQDMFLHEGTQSVQGNTFFRKRQKLRQWIEDASLPDIDKLCSKGHDIVTMLLSRLFSRTDVENKDSYQKSGEAVTAARHDLLASQDSDIRYKEHHQIPWKNLLGLDSSSYVSDHLSYPMFHRSDERIVSCANFPTSHSHKFQPPYIITEPECSFSGTASFSANSDMTLGFLSNQQEHEPIALNTFIELGKFGREPNPLLLENDCDSSVDDLTVPLSPNNAKLSRGPALSTSFDNCEEQMLNSILSARNLCSSSMLSNQPPDFNSMLDLRLLKCQEFRFGQYVYEDLDTDFNCTSLSLSYKKDHLKLSEDCNISNSCIQDSTYFSPYQPLFRGTVSNDYHRNADTDTEAWLSSSLDLISGRTCLFLPSPHQDHQNANCGTLQLALRESMSDLLKDNCKQELNGGIEEEALYQFREDVLEIYNSSFLHISMQRDKGWPFLLHDSNYIKEEDQTHKMLL